MADKTYYKWQGATIGLEVEALPPYEEKCPKRKRICMLCPRTGRDIILGVPKRITKKHSFEPPPIKKKLPKDLDEEIEYYSEELDSPKVRTLTEVLENLKNLMPKLCPQQKKDAQRLINNLNQNLARRKTNIYTYYQVQLEAIEDKKRKAQEAKDKADKIKEQQAKFPGWTPPLSLKKEDLIKFLEHSAAKLAVPKKAHEPPPIHKKSPGQYNKAILKKLARPKQYIIYPEVKLGTVSPAALRYKITPRIQKLLEVPARYAYIPPPPVEEEPVKRPKVKDMPDICSPRTKELATPVKKAEGIQDSPRELPWPIPENVLKYKPSKRIKELAQPKERE